MSSRTSSGWRPAARLSARASLATWVTLAWLTAACGEDQMSLEQLASKVAMTACKNLAPCCANEGFAYDEAACREAATRGMKEFAATFDRGLVKINSGAVRGCLEAYGRALSLCTDENPDWVMWNPIVNPRLMPDPIKEACEPVLEGLQAESSPCEETHECAQPPENVATCFPTPVGNRCFLDSWGTRAQLGEACEGNCDSERCLGGSATCSALDGLTCSLDQVCVPFATLGETCPRSACEPGTYCSNVGTCKAQYASGPCGNPPNGDECDASSYCDAMTRQCTPKLVDGSACRPLIGTSTSSIEQSCISGFCQLVGPDDYGTCATQTFSTALACQGGFYVL